MLRELLIDGHIPNLPSLGKLPNFPRLFTFIGDIYSLGSRSQFYKLKVGDQATRWARDEFDCIQPVQTMDLAEGNSRVVRTLAVIDGVLLLEYVNGLT